MNQVEDFRDSMLACQGLPSSYSGQYLLLSFSSYSFSTLHCSLMAVASAPVKMNNLYIFWPPSSTITSMKMKKYTKRMKLVFGKFVTIRGLLLLVG
jgi:hypothetical protein